MPSPTTYDYEVELQNLQKRQQIMDALQKQSLEPLQNQAGVPTSWTNVLAKIAQAYMASKGGEKLDSERKALSSRYNEDLVKGLEQYQRTSEGYKSPTMLPTADGTPHEVSVAPNSRKAIMDALATNHPVLRELAMQQLKQKPVQQGLTPKDLLTLATPESILANQADPTKWVPKKDLGQIGDIIYNKDNLQTVQLGGPGPSRSTFGGDLYQESPSTREWKKLDNAPRISTTVNASPVIAGQKAGMQEYFKNAAKRVDALGEIAQQASNNRQTLSELRNLDSQGIFSNATSGPATFLANLGQGLGVKVDASRLANTEAYNALTTDLWQGLVSKYGGNRGVTKEEATEIKKILPLAASSPEARQKLFGMLERISGRQIQQYQNANKSFAQAAKMEDPTLFGESFQDVYMPAPTEPNPVTPPKGALPPGVISFDDYVKGKR